MIYLTIDFGFIIASIAVFVVIILLLSLMLIYAKKKLLPQGQVKLIINDEHTFEVDPGSSLLSTLSENNLFLPSACRGGGTCAMCRCNISEGGGEVLHTEVNHLNRKEVKEGVRLACQVKVRGEMKIRVHEEIFGIKKMECAVISNYNVSTFIKEFKVKLPEGEHLNFKAGGYIQIDVPGNLKVDYKNFDITAHPVYHKRSDEFRSEWDNFKLWDLKMINEDPVFRAYSMANHPGEGDIVMLNIRIATPPWNKERNSWMDVNPGICSSYIFNQKPGDKVMVSGPFGEFFIKENSDREMIYIGGGAGMAPLRSHIFHMFHTLKWKHRKVSYWYGGRTKRELFYMEEFRKIEEEFDNFNFYVALDSPLPEDNWQVKSNINSPGDGFKGYIMNVLYEQYLKDHPEPEECEYYYCGPPAMADSIKKTLDELGVPKEQIFFDDFGG